MLLLRRITYVKERCIYVTNLHLPWAHQPITQFQKMPRNDPNDQQIVAHSFDIPGVVLNSRVDLPSFVIRPNHTLGLYLLAIVLLNLFWFPI